MESIVLVCFYLFFFLALVAMILLLLRNSIPNNPISADVCLVLWIAALACFLIEHFGMRALPG